MLEAIDFLRRRHRILLDEVVLESRDHLVGRYVHGRDHRHPIELEGVRREHLGPELDVGRFGQQARDVFWRRLVDVTNEPHRREPRIDVQREVPVQPYLLVVYGHDETGLEIRLDACPLLENKLVSPHELPERELLRPQVELRLGAVGLAKPQPPPCRCLIETAAECLEGLAGQHVIVLTPTRRDHGRHHEVDEIPVRFQQ